MEMNDPAEDFDAIDWTDELRMRASDDVRKDRLQRVKFFWWFSSIVSGVSIAVGAVAAMSVHGFEVFAWLFLAFLGLLLGLLLLAIGIVLRCMVK
jgi:hypothetical protein